MNNINKLKVRDTSTIRNAFKQMDLGGISFCVIVSDNDIVVGVLSDGDFRRAILNNIELGEEVSVIINKVFFSVNKIYEKHEIEEIFHDSLVQCVPVIEGNLLIDVITRENFYGISESIHKEQLDNSVVIMAGGKGARLDPFTRILPKPLIPVGIDPIIKVIMDDFHAYGISDFHVSLNDKGRMIKAYFCDHDLNYNINFIEESKPLGTAGALKYLHGDLNNPFFVSNCDIIVKCDYKEVLEFHIDRGYDLTIIGSMQHHVVPYGVCEINNGGDLIGIREKPEYDYITNTGMYLMQPEVLKYIPNEVYFDMTTLIGELQKNNLRVGVFPVSSQSWFDVGQWPEYEKTSNFFMPK
jgi:dTDP-glucose pyrophosphorylase